ncbi:MAG TPA: fumarylacetoacetate hydrolase family protein [Streptosporangiaceae bacterium]|nr:fumarylacetoacetate hydrolase family protein [Streptosporangiaceae bacterium]
MRIARFAVGDEVAYGVVVDDASGDANGARQAQSSESGSPSAGLSVAEIAGHPFGPSADGPKLTGARYPIEDVRLLAPVLPSKIVAIGRNYAEHARELGNEVPAEPLIFLKPSTAVVGPGDAIVRPVQLSERVDFEGELAIVFGRLCRDVPPARVPEVIFGYTCANDVTARDLQAKDGQWTRAKGFDTFCPLGPWIETSLDPADVQLTTTVNGQVKQDSRTSLLIHDIATLVGYVTAVMTMLPGDVLLTGTPAGIGPLVAGDSVSVSVEGIGELTNRVVDGT